MFRAGQILTPTKFTKNFREVANHVAQYPQAILVTQGSVRRLILVDTELFDEMMERVHQGPIEIPQDTALNFQLEGDY